MKVEYSSNNSGGRWWLSDQNWTDLEKAGWEVDWERNRSGARIFAPDADGRWLGALAQSATRHGLPLREAADEWEKITGQCATDAGCPCCGQPHTFTEYDDEGRYVESGPEVSYSASW